MLTVLADSDGDRLPDNWEIANQFNPNVAGDGTNDVDGDSLSNRQEYLAGTDPRDALSYLKVDRLTGSGLPTLEFRAVSNKTYSVLWKPSLESGNWSVLTNILAYSTNRLERALVAESDVVGEPDERPEMAHDPARLALVRQELGGGRVQLGLGRRCVVGLHHARVRLRHLGQRPERDAVAVRERAALEPRNRIAALVHRRAQLEQHPALADPREPDERDELRDSLAACTGERIPEQCELLAAADERRVVVRLLAAWMRARRDGDPDRNGLGLAFRRDGVAFAELDRVARGPVRRRPSSWPINLHRRRTRQRDAADDSMKKPAEEVAKREEPKQPTQDKAKQKAQPKQVEKKIEPEAKRAADVEADPMGGGTPPPKVKGGGIRDDTYSPRRSSTT